MLKKVRVQRHRTRHVIETWRTQSSNCTWRASFLYGICALICKVEGAWMEVHVEDSKSLRDPERFI